MQSKSAPAQLKEYTWRDVKSAQPTSKSSRSCFGDTSPSTGLPSISYRVALASWFLLPDGTIRNVEGSTDEEFTEFIRACTPNMLPWQRNDLLSCLTDDAQLGRWYILDALKHRHIHIPLFASQEACSASV